MDELEDILAELLEIGERKNLVEPDISPEAVGEPGD